MSFIDTFEAELVKRLQENDDATLVRWVSEQVLQSYKNGIEAGKKGATVFRKGTSRRHHAVPEAR